jgi:hypothetical protein
MPDPIRDRPVRFDPPQSTSDEIRSFAHNASSRRVRVDAPIERIPVTGDHAALAFVQNAQLRAVGAADASFDPKPMQARLDAFRERMSGPYVVDGKTVSAPPAFRMNGGYNPPEPKAHAAVVAATGGRYGEIALAEAGRPSPEQLHRVTQALIDAGHLEPGNTAQERVHAMQWKYSVGIDCAGYAQQAFLSAHGAEGQRARYGFNPQMVNESLAGLPRNPHFQKVDPLKARTGDLFTLLKPAPNEVGHAVVVYANTPLDAATKAQFEARHPEAKAFFAGGATHDLQVDSSVGGGPTGVGGGVKREHWFLNEGASPDKRWAHVDHEGRFQVGREPCDPIDGVYRPRNEVAR